MTPQPSIVRSRFNTNRWNRFRYSVWAPVYDLLTAATHSRRRQSVQLLNLQPGERVLLVGAGTGLDLDFIPKGVRVTATDITPAMLARLQRRATRLGLAVEARVMDGQALEFPDGSFDAVILHLIVAVIPDPVRCVREAARVLKPGGRAVIFDKFAPEGAPPPLLMRLFNHVMGFLASEVVRQLGPILAGSGLQIVREAPGGYGGWVRLVLLKKS